MTDSQILASITTPSSSSKTANIRLGSCLSMNDVAHPRPHTSPLSSRCAAMTTSFIIGDRGWMGMSRRSGDAYCESRRQIPTKPKLLLVVQQVTRPPRHFRDDIVGQRDAGAIVSGRAEGALATDAPKNHRNRAPIETNSTRPRSSAKRFQASCRRTAAAR